MTKDNQKKVTSESVKAHPALVRIVGALLDRVEYSEIATRFGLPESAVEAYAIEAGLAAARGSEPPSAQHTTENREASKAGQVEDRVAVHEHQVLEEQSRRRGDPAGSPPDPDASLDEVRRQEHEEQLAGLAAIDAERQEYESRPAPLLQLVSDPDFRAGFQTSARQAADVVRRQIKRAERLAEWRDDPFNWGREPPDDW